MKKLFKLLLVMFTLYLIVQVAFRIFGKGYSLNYQLVIDKEKNIVANVEEIYISRTKNEITSYLLNIMIGEKKFTIETDKNFYYSSKLIKDIKYYSGKYQCIYPIFKGKEQLTDVICLDGELLRNYQSIVGLEPDLDNFVKTLENDKLYVNNFKDNKDEPYQLGSLASYTNNLTNDHYFAINNYQGVFTLSLKNPRKLYDVKLFNKDVYDRKLTALVGNYYVSADYDQNYDFNRLKIVNIKNNDKSDFDLNTSISFNSYIQGVVKDDLYLVDKSNKKQYRINIKNRTLKEIGNENIETDYYSQGVWSKLNIYEVVNQYKYFDTGAKKETKEGFVRVDKVGGERTGYRYYYKQNGSIYDVYRSTVAEPNQLTYLFTTTSLDHITYVDNYIYYMEYNSLKVYHDMIGNRTIYKNNEYEFNKTLRYFITK